MGYRQPDFEDEWEGLEPEQPEEGGRWLLWLGTGAVVLFLIGICLFGGYLLVQQFQKRTETAPPLIVPTSPVDTPTAAPVATATESTAEEEPTEAPPTATPTDIPFAPTATPRPTEVAPTPVVTGQVEAKRLNTPPAVDGDLTEWTSSVSYESAFRVFSASAWDGSDDVTAQWRLGWDSDHLYIAVIVEDNSHVQTQTGNQIFRGDSLDMQFDTDRDGDFGDALSPDDIQIIFSPGNFGGLPPSAFRFQGTHDGQILDAPGGHHVSVFAIPTSAGYQLEAAIPWSDLNLVPSPGLLIGLALNVNDNDGPGTAVQEVMKSHIATRTLSDPTSWGTLVLK